MCILMHSPAPWVATVCVSVQEMKLIEHAYRRSHSRYFYYYYFFYYYYYF